MSDHRYISNSANLFEDEINDDDFVNSYRSKLPQSQSRQSTTSYGAHIGDLERNRQTMLERQREIEQRTLDSSARSIGLLRESEQIGIATAEELVRQREQLQNTNDRLDEINTNLNYSQKHINGIKSMFFAMKSYISGKSDQTPRQSNQPSPDNGMPKDRPSGSRLEETLNSIPKDMSRGDLFSSHPSTRLRGLDEPSTDGATHSDSQRVNKMLDDNLDEMLQHISRMKNLGIDLGREIEDQNNLIDTIQDKVEGADIRINKQNKQINKLLGK